MIYNKYNIIKIRNNINIINNIEIDNIIRLNDYYNDFNNNIMSKTKF